MLATSKHSFHPNIELVNFIIIFYLQYITGLIYLQFYTPQNASKVRDDCNRLVLLVV